MKKFLLLFLLLPLYTNAQVIVTAVGTGVQGFFGDGGPAINAKLYMPYGIALDDSGNLYICDEANRRIRKVSPGYGGIITTIAGDGTCGDDGDGGLGIYAQTCGALYVAVDYHGNVYIADGDNHRIRKVNPSGIITTIAGTGVFGYNGDGIAATSAQLNSPQGITVDSVGNIYVVDRYNYRIRKIDTVGIITSIAGTGIAGFSPDGSRADTAKLYNVIDIRINKTGNIFYFDEYRIRKIDTAGIITTIAGNGNNGFSGDGGPATAAKIDVAAIAVDSAGNILFADQLHDRIRMVNPAGIINTIAGNGMHGNNGDGGDPLLAELCEPAGVAISNSGDIYIGNVGCNRIRLITVHPLGINNVFGIAQGISVYPNPCNGYCTVQITAAINEQADIVISNVTGTEVYRSKMHTNQSFSMQPDWPAGIYFISATTAQQHFYQKMIIQ